MIKRKLLVLMALVGLGFSLVPAMPTLANQHDTNVAPCNAGGNFFSFPTWYKYLDCDEGGNGSPVIGQDGEGNYDLNQLWLIGAAVFEMLSRVAGLLAVFLIIWGGFRYITSVGNADQASNARKTIINALIGLIIAIMATALVSFTVQTLSGGTDDLSQVSTTGTIERVLSFVYAVAGAASVIAIIIGGLKFVTSSGDPQGVNSARNTIIYAVIGLVVVIFASLITTFVLGQLG